jgi:unsaturated rhamnogalacturonyl hydrolase
MSWVSKLGLGSATVVLSAGYAMAQVEPVAFPAVAAPAVQNPQQPPPASSNQTATAQRPNPNRVLERVLSSWPAGRIDTAARPGEWSSEEGVLLDGMIAEWRATGDARLFAYVQATVDRSVDEQGVIHLSEDAAFPVEAHALDNLQMGRSVLTMYRVLQQPRYYQAAKFLHDQMLMQPKTASGGYWQAQGTPNQMWLDGAYMAEPFLENYAKTFAHPQEMDAVASQMLLIDAKLRERQTGLLRQGWDESQKAEWASKKSGQSAEILAQGVGWYAMALVDVLERMPASDPQRAATEAVARRVLQAIARAQDGESGLWWQVMDKGSQKGNFLEASSSCMFVYSLAKGIRLGLLPFTYEPTVIRGWEGIEKRFVKADGTFTGTARRAAPGNAPHPSASYEEAVALPQQDNDARGVGAYLLALSEVTQRKRTGELLRKTVGRTVLVDAWFNSETRKTADGNIESYHYKWTDDSDQGYSAWGRMFQQYGMHTEALDHAPRAEDLKGVEIYVIASPDMPLVNPDAHYMDKQSADAIEAWVKSGGTLVLMENDAQHADQTYFDLLSDKFGMHFNPVLRNPQAGDDYADTMVRIAAGTGGIFRRAHTAMMKQTCTLTVSAPAKTILSDKGEAFMAAAHVGKGLVYANVDPWLYNEYTDGRRLPMEEDNFSAGQELTRWLVADAVSR